MNEKIDINYIAKKANVSRSTVSRVLTKKTNVKESTREKVEQVMAELNYHPITTSIYKIYTKKKMQKCNMQ